MRSGLRDRRGSASKAKKEAIQPRSWSRRDELEPSQALNRGTEINERPARSTRRTEKETTVDLPEKATGIIGGTTERRWKCLVYQYTSPGSGFFLLSYGETFSCSLTEGLPHRRLSDIDARNADITLIRACEEIESGRERENEKGEKEKELTCYGIYRISGSINVQRTRIEFYERKWLDMKERETPARMLMLSWKRFRNPRIKAVVWPFFRVCYSKKMQDIYVGRNLQLKSIQEKITSYCRW